MQSESIYTRSLMRINGMDYRKAFAINHHEKLIKNLRIVNFFYFAFEGNGNFGFLEGEKFLGEMWTVLMIMLRNVKGFVENLVNNINY